LLHGVKLGLQSCLLKIIKLRLFGGGEKEPQYSSECDVATSPSDRDPFILQAENKVFIDNNIVQETEVGFSAESSDNPTREKTSGEMPAIRSLQVKYSENKRPYKVCFRGAQVASNQVLDLNGDIAEVKKQYFS